MPAPESVEAVDRLLTPDADEEFVDSAQAYRDRASYTPERYIVVRPLSAFPAHVMAPEIEERIESVLRQRTPARAVPDEPAAPAADGGAGSGSMSGASAGDPVPAAARTR